MPTTASPIELIETHFGGLRDPKAKHSSLDRHISHLHLCGTMRADNFIEDVKYC